MDWLFAQTLYAFLSFQGCKCEGHTVSIQDWRMSVVKVKANRALESNQLFGEMSLITRPGIVNLASILGHIGPKWDNPRFVLFGVNVTQNGWQI